MFSEFRTYKFTYLVKVMSLAFPGVTLILIAKQLTGCPSSHTCHSFQHSLWEGKAGDFPIS